MASDPHDSSLLSSVPDLPEIITRYRSGESIQILAQEHTVSRQTIYNWILAGLGDEHYHQLVTECLVRRIADADAKIEDESFDIARAREMAKYARMDFERRRPHLYGPKQEIQSRQVIVIVDRSAKPIENQTTYGSLSSPQPGPTTACGSDDSEKP